MNIDNLIKYLQDIRKSEGNLQVGIRGILFDPDVPSFFILDKDEFEIIDDGFGIPALTLAEFEEDDPNEEDWQ